MKKPLLATLFLFAFVVTGCGGGSSNSGTATPYAGQYDGVLNMNIQGFGVSGSDSVAYRVVVGVNGLVTTSTPGFSGSATCQDTGEKVYIDGNVATSSSTTTCYEPNLGTCTATGQFTFTFNSSAASVSGSANFSCSAGNFTVIYSAYLSKTT